MQAIGLRNIHYALLTEDSDSALTYGTPQPLAGAISATISPTSNQENLYADDGVFDTQTALGDISLEMELATLPLKTQAVLLGHTYASGVMVQKDTDVPPYVAIGFMARTTKGNYRFAWLLKGKFALKEDDYATMEDAPKWNNPKLSGTFVKRVYDGEWQRVAGSGDEDFTGAETWFDKVPGDQTAASQS